MSISSQAELDGMTAVSKAVAYTLKMMREYAKPGMSTKTLDDYGKQILEKMGANSAPYLTYKFPGYTCISVNNEIAHGIPSEQRILQNGDLVNIDVSAELNGFWADNGGSFILGDDLQGLQPLVSASKRILYKAIHEIHGGVKINEIGGLISREARRSGFTVIKNLVGHGVGRGLHEAPHEIPCFHDRHNRAKFKINSVVAVETFISTKGTEAFTDQNDGWTLKGIDGTFVAQHEHTILITDSKPIILTLGNEIWN
ncbi:type I methionyl aminopeptidase [Chitinophaga caeni]|uniref:Methionine aminopeptidase n=1 Tax=Chitinophaga caeni TaxID=2029983 RepID=A0A291QP60_9BACT|nr:type I methionyl aminopeptidase [Chitinophaga caeni]ATL45740.1 type I methionyl aminopeptidase [Chitinophaga caeni]